MASKCRKFVPNIFNKSKCQTCFGAKEMHSAEALENNKASRKISKCGYLFVAPEFDFSNPVNKGKRWQRRFFVLYDDAELTFSVDENPDTVPQGVVDMNKVTDVVDCEAYTGHPFSIAIKSPDKTYYVKGGSKEEIQWWHDILIEFPRALKSIKPRRKTTICVANAENGQSEGVSSKSRTSSEGSINSDLHARDGDASRGRPRGDFPAYSTFRGVRSLKHKYDKNHQEGLRKSSSLHDLSAKEREMEAPTTLGSSRFLSRSGDRLDWVSSSSSSVSSPTPGEGATRGSGASVAGRLPLLSQSRYAHNPYCTITRTHALSIPPPRRLSPSTFLHPSTSTTATTTTTSTAQSASTSTSSSATSSPTRRGSFDERNSGARKKNLTAAERARLHRERSASLKDFSAHLSVAQGPQAEVDDSSHPGGERRSEGGAPGAQSEDPSPAVSADETASNETDELKMARSDLSMVGRSQSLASPAVAESRPTKYEDLVYMKKGWLVKQANTEKESKKHWFVLAGNSLRYYNDSKAEEAGNLDGRIDLSTCSEVSEVPLNRIYGFKIKTRNGEHVLGAMTSGIRNNWMKAIRLCMDLHNPAGRKTTIPGLQMSGLAQPPRAQDDFELGATHASTSSVAGSRGETAFQLVGRKESAPSKKESTRVARRHHSDVSPGNVSKVLSIKEFSSFDVDDNTPSSAASTPTRDSEQGSQSGSDIGDGTPRLDSSAQNSPRPRGTKIPKHQTSPDSSSWAQTHLPIRRFVEGSDVTSAPGAAAVAKEPKRVAASESSKEEKELERMRRAKSPSARLKERTRRMQSPSRMDSSSSGSSYYRLSAAPNPAPIADVESFESEDDVDMGRDLLSQERYSDSPRRSSVDDGSSAPASISGEGRLVELLESESQLESTYAPVRRQLPSGHDGSGDESRRQLKDARDTVGRQKLELETLHSKLDMSMSKLTGTEKALSEALKELKHEKEKFLKLQGDWNRRIRGMEGQLKDTVNRLDKTKENLTAKERECWRLESEIKGNLQRTRDQEREILKLKAVEQDYRQMKARLDDREREIAALQDQMKEQAQREKKLEASFHEQLAELEQEFARERDDMEQHLEQLKQQLCEAHQRQTTMTSSLTSNIADILHDKDDLIAQLEDQLADSDRKMGDMTEELQAEVKENAELMALNDTLQEQRDLLAHKLAEMEGELVGLQEQLGRVEGEGDSLRQQVDALQQERRLLGEQLEAERRAAQSYQRERDQYQATIRDLNDKIQNLQFRLIEKFEDIDRSVGSGSTEGMDATDLLHHIIIADSELKEVNALLTDLQTSFDRYMTTLQDDTRSHVEAMANLMKEVGRKCRDVQDTLKGVPQSPTPSSPGQAPEVRGVDYSHSVTVDENSPAPVILAEYREMKSKFDRAVAEVKKLRKEVNDVYSRYDRMEQQEKALKEQLHSMELSYKQRLEVLVSRVETLTFKVDSRRQKPVASPPAPTATSASTSEEIERHIKDLDSKLTSVEKSFSERSGAAQAAESATSSASSPLLAEEAQVFVSKLNEMKMQLDSTSAKLKSSQAGPASNSLQSHLSRCGQKIESLSKKVEEAAKTAPPVVACDGGGCGESDEEEEEEERGAVNSGEPVAVNKCLLEVKDRIMEIGEQLDALDEETDSEDEEDEEENTIEAVREKLAGILEYIEQHAKLSQKEWKVLGLVRAQQEAATQQQASHAAETPVSADQQLKQYRDRLALEAVIMGEMAFLLQNMSSGSSQDAFLTELNLLNSQIITLHQQLETETRSMHMDDAKEDVLTSYAALLAEKIVLEGKLMPAEEEGEEEEEEGERVATKPTILAAEALLRSQLDSFISAGLDKSLGDMEQASSHIVTKALVQGELTYALHRMREKVGVVERRGGNRQEASRDFAFQEMKSRMAMVEELVGAYKLKMVHALAVVITKDTEEMTIVEGPESLLEGICSEISTCMEKHIQNFKEKMRSAASHPDVSRKAELAVNSLRALREVVLTAIRQEHQAYNSQDRDEDEHDEVQVPFQSLDATINNFGEILSQQAIVSAGLDYLQELYESGLEESMDSESSLLEDKEPATDIDKSLSIFVKNLSEAIKVEAEKKQQLSEELAKRIGERDQSGARDSEDDPEAVVLSMPSVGGLSQGLKPYPVALVREAVFQVQLAYTLHKQRLQHQQELEQLKRVFPGARKAGTTSQDSTEEELDLQTLLLPMEEVLETKLEDECQVLSVLQQHCSQVQEALASHASLEQVEEMVRQLEQTFAHEISRAQERHETHLELFKQEAGKLEAKWEERENECAAYEGRCEQLHDDILTLQTEHDEEMDRMRQDIMTAVSAIRANEEQSETQLADQVHRLTMQLAAQRESFKTFLEGVKRESAGKVSAKTIERAEEQLSLLEQGIIPEPLPKHLDEDVTDGAEATEASSGNQESTHVQELEQLRREKEEALAEEVKNTKAALEAMKKAYEEDLSAEKEKYREALVTMYTDDFVNEIRRRHEYEVEKLKDEVKQLSLHYSSKCEDYKLLEMKLQQTKTDYDSHIQQLIKSNGHLEQLVNQEIEKIKEHIRNKEPSPARLTGNHTLEEELSDAQIMIRVKDAELQKLRSQVKNLENSLQRTTEEHRQTMTQHLQLMKQHGEMQTQFKKEKGELHDRIEQLLEASGSRRPIRRTPSFHSRARSPSPQSTTSPAQKDKSEHSSRDSHRKRHIAPKDLRRSKSSPSLPYVFDAKRPGTREGPGGRRPSATKATKY